MAGRTSASSARPARCGRGSFRSSRSTPSHRAPPQGGKGFFAFVSLDAIAREPHFRSARQAGTVDALELDEGMFLLGLQAAAWRGAVLPAPGGLWWGGGGRGG